MANYYPPVAFHFRVDIEGLTTGDKDVSFQEVSGLNATVGEFTYNEGGENRFVHRLPDRITYDKLVLLNENHEPLEAWNFVKAYPVKWSISNFNAQGNELVVETIELAYQYFTRMEVN